MAKKYQLSISDDIYEGDMVLYAGQVWMTGGLAQYRKITKIVDKENSRLTLHYRDKDSEKGASCDVDDMVIWIVENNAKPLIIDYQGVVELEQ
jgi:hypothetical protein